MTFRCTQCKQSFEVEEGTPRCPQCGSFLVEPQAPSGTGEPGGPPQPAPAAPRAAPVLPGQSDEDFMSDMYALRRMAGPAWGLTISAGLGITLQALGLIQNVINMLLDVEDERRTVDLDLSAMGAEGAQIMEQVGPYLDGANLFFGLVGVLLGIVVFCGARQMKKLGSRSLAKTAAILAVIPCTSPCCVLGIPFGIWALVVMSDSRVSTAFRG